MKVLEVQEEAFENWQQSKDDLDNTIRPLSSPVFWTSARSAPFHRSGIRLEYSAVLEKSQKRSAKLTRTNSRTQELHSYDEDRSLRCPSREQLWAIERATLYDVQSLLAASPAFASSYNIRLSTSSAFRNTIKIMHKPKP
jgi:hypothetical protein